MNSNIIGDPSYYELVSCIRLNKVQYYPIITRDCCLITYKSTSLNDPNSVPLCKFHYAGVLKFMFNDNEYAACDIDKKQLDIKSKQLDDAGLIENYNQIQWWLGRLPSEYIGAGNNQRAEQLVIRRNPRLASAVLSAFSKIENAAEEYYRICVYEC